MQQKLHTTIQMEWNKISNEEHRSLIFTYLTLRAENTHCSWMDFLLEHFNISKSNKNHPIGFNPPQGKRT